MFKARDKFLNEYWVTNPQLAKRTIILAERIDALERRIEQLEAGKEI